MHKAIAVLGGIDSSNNGDGVAHALKARSKARLRTQVSARAQITRSTLSVGRGEQNGSNEQSPCFEGSYVRKEDDAGGVRIRLF